MSRPHARPLPPLRKSIVVAGPPAAAFRRFTDEMSSWWPLASHSVAGPEAESVRMEGGVGGRIVERSRAGVECVWGTVTAWEPPGRLAFTWHPGQPVATFQDIEVLFTADGDGTRVDLTHTGWERLGAMAVKARRGYPIGWTYVLLLYAGRRSSLLVRAIDALSWLLAPLQRRMQRKMEAAMAAASAEH